MTAGETIATLSGVAVIIGQIGTTYVLITKARRDAINAQEDRADLKAHLKEQDTKLIALHESTNGLSKRAEDLAQLLGEAKGRADEKANPT